MSCNYREGIDDWTRPAASLTVILFQMSHESATNTGMWPPLVSRASGGSKKDGASSRAVAGTVAAADMERPPPAAERCSRPIQITASGAEAAVGTRQTGKVETKRYVR